MDHTPFTPGSAPAPHFDPDDDAAFEAWCESFEQPGARDDEGDAPSRGGAPSGFGRGWIPAGRDIGLPDEALRHARQRAADRRAWRHAAQGLCEIVSDPAETGGEELSAWVSDVPVFTPEGRLAPRSRRPAHNGWTPDRRRLFLEHLAQRGHVRAACALVDMSPEAAYKLRRRDAAFAAAWDAALVQSRRTYEEVLAVRALDGIEEQIWYRGELVGVRYKQDSRLLLAHLARLDRHAETTPHAAARADRLDELVALACGAELPEALLPPSTEHAPPSQRLDPLLPLPRARHVAEAGERAAQEGRWAQLEATMARALAEHRANEHWREARNPEAELTDEEREALDEAEDAAAEAAEAEAAQDWDRWQAQAHAVADGEDADEAGEEHAEPEAEAIGGANAGATGDAGAGAAALAEEEAGVICPVDPPVEYKSLDPVYPVNFGAAEPNLDQPCGTLSRTAACLSAATAGSRRARTRHSSFPAQL